jgi:hypothetical protein
MVVPSLSLTDKFLEFMSQAAIAGSRFVGISNSHPEKVRDLL